MAERQGRRLRRRRIDVRRFCPDLIEAHFWLGRSRLRVTPGWRHLKSESTGDGRPMRTIPDTERARLKGAYMPGAWRPNPSHSITRLKFAHTLGTR